MTTLNSERQKRSHPLVKPWEMYDLVGGTGTGGFVYAFLIEDCGIRLVG
jgi:hypothetical protein